jgi:EAL domain-containing protein (putative c-di-GMP-specific phosphodiesterase class I)
MSTEIEIEHHEAEVGDLILFPDSPFQFSAQPIVHNSSLEPFACELLVRPLGEGRSPLSLFSQAEQQGVEDQFDARVFHDAIMCSGRIVAREEIRCLFVNIRLRTLMSQWIIPVIERFSRKSPDSILVIEINERDHIVDWGQMRDRIDLIHHLGHLVAIDDFGAGNANFRALLEVPVDFVKLDGDVFPRAAVSRRSLGLYRGMLQMLTDYGVKTITEGIENQGLLAEVKTMPTDFLQGYAIARPMMKE